MGGVDLNSRDGGGGTPLHNAAEDGNSGIVSTLLVRGADKNALDNYGYTPLIWASDEGRVCVVETLLAAGADFKIRASDGLSALDMAARKEHVPVLQAILSHEADVNDRGEQGFTVLHVAALHGQTDAIRALIEAGADIELENDFGETPFLLAGLNNRCKAMLALLLHGASLDVRDNDGNTALHLACLGAYTGLEAAVDLLLRRGADETALNEYGQTPADKGRRSERFSDESATHDEIERTRLLLSRAPADRAWRRRGWLVMLRTRRASHDSGGDGGGAAGSNGDATGQEGGRCKEVKTESGSRQSRGTGVDGGEGQNSCMSKLVGLLVELEPDGVFRTIMGFL